MREQKPESETGVIHEWDVVAYLVDTLSLSCHRHIPAGGNNDSRAITAAAVDYITSAKPMLFAVTYDNPDHVGHAIGHDTPLIISGPGIKNVGELKSAVMQFDVVPTIAALLGVTPPQPWTGRPIIEALE